LDTISPHLRAAIAISLGAISGALSRYYLGLWFAQRFGSAFPYGTLFINLSGCLLMGVFTVIVLERVPNLAPDVRLLVSVGYLGAYTTFSTYVLETSNLLQTGHSLVACLYWTGSSIVGLICLEAGKVLARKLI
jgi:fluoride exporter